MKKVITKVFKMLNKGKPSSIPISPMKSNIGNIKEKHSLPIEEKYMKLKLLNKMLIEHIDILEAKLKNRFIENEPGIGALNIKVYENKKEILKNDLSKGKSQEEREEQLSSDQEFIPPTKDLKNHLTNRYNKYVTFETRILVGENFSNYFLLFIWKLPDTSVYLKRSLLIIKGFFFYKI